MSSKKKQKIIEQIENVLINYYKHIEEYGDSFIMKDASETMNLQRLLTRAIAVTNRVVDEDSVYSSIIDNALGRSTNVKEQVKYVVSSLEGLVEDLKKDFIDISETKPISLKFDSIIEDIELEDPKYKEIISEINGTYQDYYFTSMYILIRKLLENLLYDCLKSYYGTTDIDKYYNTGQDRHHGFGTLISNFNGMINTPDFKRDVGDVEQGYIDFLKKFQEKGNKNAHSLFNLPHQDFIEEQKEKINNIIRKLKDLVT